MRSSVGMQSYGCAVASRRHFVVRAGGLDLPQMPVVGSRPCPLGGCATTLLLLIASYTATAIMYLLWFMAIYRHLPTRAGLAVLATGLGAASTTGLHWRRSQIRRNGHGSGPR